MTSGISPERLQEIGAQFVVSTHDSSVLASRTAVVELFFAYVEARNEIDELRKTVDRLEMALQVERARS